MPSYRILDRTNAVSKPPAQYTTLWQAAGNLAARNSIVVDLLTKPNELSALDQAVVEVMFLSGCRISQAIGIKPNQINVNGSIKIIGSKKSSDTIVFPVYSRNFWINNKSNIDSLLCLYSRFYFYRLFKKKGLVYKLNGKQNLNVTHSLRQLFIDSLAHSNIEPELIKKSVGHKSIKSQDFYISK